MSVGQRHGYFVGTILVMIRPLFGVLGIFLILIVSEFLWRAKKLRGEKARKFIHISSGVFIAFWPFFMTFRDIQLISVAMVAVVALSRTFKVFKGVHGGHRKTMGDLIYPLTIGLIATAISSPWIFAVAILHLALADGMAAVIGDRWGKTNRYRVFGEVKSIAGTTTFLFFSILITSYITIAGPIEFRDNAVLLITFLPPLATATENLSIKGTDNFFVPLVVTAALSIFVR